MSAVKKADRVSRTKKTERRMGRIRNTHKRAKGLNKKTTLNPYVMRDTGPIGAGDDNGATGKN